MRFFTAVVVATFFLKLSTSLSPTFGTHVLHEKRDYDPPQWERLGRADPQQRLPVRIALRQRNVEHAEEYIYDVADPRSPNYGKHWSAQKVANTFAPHPETKKAVMDWLVESGISRSRLSLSKGHSWVQFNGTVEESERLFATQCWHYPHTGKGGYHLDCDEYSIPNAIREHIDFVMPILQFKGFETVTKHDYPRIHQISFPEGTDFMSHDCSSLMTIDCLRELYKFPVANTSAEGNELGIAAFHNFLYESDLPIFFRNFTSPQIPADTLPEFVSIDGGLRANELPHIFESALDVQTAYSIIYPQGVRFYQVGDEHAGLYYRTFDVFLDALDESYCSDAADIDISHQGYDDDGDQTTFWCGGAPKSNVLSVSYGWDEVERTPAYQRHQCREWMKLGLQGVSVIFSSGDWGVASRQHVELHGHVHHMCLDATRSILTTYGNRFVPDFPVNCPFITAVGATGLNSHTPSCGERASVAFGSGGGFSDVFPLPDYQAQAVQHYMDNYAPNYGSQVYNDSGLSRGYPDVAAIGENLPTVIDGTLELAYGTSASAPIFASIVTLLNEARIAVGKGPLGFLNPMLYQNPDAFNDITAGSNWGCWTKGFTAVPGWDPVTGLGTPNFEKLRDVVLALP